MAKKIKCPVCSKETNWDDNSFRPFCSEKCSLVDLGKWADGKYAIKGKDEKEEGEEEKE